MQRVHPLPAVVTRIASPRSIVGTMLRVKRGMGEMTALLNRETHRH
jgi:hypothetical protein